MSQKPTFNKNQVRFELAFEAFLTMLGNTSIDPARGDLFDLAQHYGNRFADYAEDLNNNAAPSARN